MRYGQMKTDELGEVSSIVGDAFAFAADEAASWLSKGGLEHLRVVRDAGRVVAALLQIPMGQYFGGKSVPTVGIAGVGVGIVDRGRGAGQTLMQSTIREIASRGVALSTLYPSTQTLYRSAGYERAGKLMRVTLPTHLFRAPRTSLVARRLTSNDESKAAELYREVAPAFPGYLDRGPYIWNRVRKPKQAPSVGVGFFASKTSSLRNRRERLEAYLYFTQMNVEASIPFHMVSIKDVAARSSAGYDAVVRFLGDQRSIGRKTEFRGGPSSPLLMRLAEPHYEEESLEDWMVRITHLSSALTSRGYPIHLSADLHLEIDDPLVAENSGRFVLVLRDGEPTLRKGGKGSLALDVRALAPLYTGYLSATALARLGMLNGSPATLALADAVFVSSMPSMCEMF
jgi:predicted acetyltransferase